MPDSHSVIHAPESAWGSLLRERALAAPVEYDRSAILDWFCGHSAFYSGRIDANQAWEQVQPLDKQDVAVIPVSADDSIREARTSGTSGFQVSIHNTGHERFPGLDPQYCPRAPFSARAVIPAAPVL